MKNWICYVLVILGLYAVLASVPSARAEKIEAVVEGMTCGSCVKAVTSSLKKNPEVSTVTIELEQGLVKVETKDSVTDEAIRSAITTAGYEVKEIRHVK